MDEIAELALRLTQEAAFEDLVALPPLLNEIGPFTIPAVKMRRRLQEGDVVRITRDHVSKVDGTFHFPAGTAGVVKSDEDSCGNVWVVFPETKYKKRFGINQTALELQEGITGRAGLPRLMAVSRYPRACRSR